MLETKPWSPVRTAQALSAAEPSLQPASFRSHLASCHLSTAIPTLHPFITQNIQFGIISSSSSWAFVLNKGSRPLSFPGCFIFSWNTVLPNLPNMSNSLSSFSVSAMLWFPLYHNLHNLVGFFLSISSLGCKLLFTSLQPPCTPKTANSFSLLETLLLFPRLG